MIDIHSHILPGLDDGAPDMESALEMLRLAAEHGTTGIVATPHADARYRFDAVDVERRIAELREQAGGGPRIHYGCELHLTPENIQEALHAPSRYTIAHGCYLLVEFSNLLVPKSSGEILKRLSAAGAQPIIVHPERNPILRQRTAELERWVEDGCLLQVTAQSLVGRFGSSAEKAGLQLVAQGLAHCVASDAHDPKRRTPVLDQARRVVRELAGEDVACRLFEANPKAIVNSLPIAKQAPARKKSWFAVW
jgi:protein-tyrosine phosphatase